MEKRVSNLEKRMDKVEQKLRITPRESGTPVKCSYCGYIMNVRSKLPKISCSSCGNKTKNTSIEEPEEKFDAFKGERYKDYDFKDMKKTHFGKNKFSKCCDCGKKLDFESGYYGFNGLRCKKCYEEISKSNDEAVSKMTKEFL